MSATLPQAGSAGNDPLAEFLLRFRDDPLAFVMAAYPWGEKGTSLERWKEPEPWQKRLLVKLGEHCRANTFRRQQGLDMEDWRSVVASGHGVGKSALVAWLVHWIMSTRRETRGVVTANTQAQLEKKTWPELSKWHQLSINRSWFTWTASAFYSALYPEDERRNYQIDAISVAEERTEAFAGLHNEGKSIVMIFDEASALSPKLWEVVEGAATDSEFFFFAFGNPTRAEGEFYERFADKVKGKYYYRDTVDSREVSFTNKTVISRMLETWGEDSDFARIRVKGMFPRVSYDGLISVEVAGTAAVRDGWHDGAAPLVMAVDVARFGDDSTEVAFRQGANARVHPWDTLRGADNVAVARRVAELANRYKPDVIVIEGTGPGTGVIDILKSLRFRIVEVHPGASEGKPQFYNVRARMWCDMRDWLRDKGMIPNHPDLLKQLVSIRYSYAAGEQKMLLEPKKALKDRLGMSPDKADALALTFAHNVAHKRAFDVLGGSDPRLRRTALTEYDMFAQQQE